MCPWKRVKTSLLSLDNIEALSKLRLSGHTAHANQRGEPADRALEFILAVPGRRYGEFTDILKPIHARAETLQKEATEEPVQGNRPAKSSCRGETGYGWFETAVYVGGAQAGRQR